MQELERQIERARKNDLAQSSASILPQRDDHLRKKGRKFSFVIYDKRGPIISFSFMREI